MLCAWWAAATPTSRPHDSPTKDAVPGAPPAVIEDLAAQGGRARHPHGLSADIVGDDTAYVWDLMTRMVVDRRSPVWDYGAPVSALCDERQYADAEHLLPGSHPIRSGALLLLKPPVAYYEIDNRVRTVPRPASAKISVAPRCQAPASCSSSARCRSTAIRAMRKIWAIDYPALFAAVAFRDALLRHGIAIRGGARAVHLYREPSAI